MINCKSMQKHVERGITIPNGQGVPIQQAVEQFCISYADLGKRKLQDDLELDERRMSLDERRMLLQTQSIENEKQRSEIQISGVVNCAEALTALDPTWKSNQRMVLQLQDVLTRDILRDYSSGAAGSANTSGQFTPRQRGRWFRSGKSRWR